MAEADRNVALIFSTALFLLPGTATLITHSATVTVTLQCKCFRRSERETDGSSHFCVSEAKSVDMEFKALQEKKKCIFSTGMTESSETPERESLGLIFSKINHVRAPTPANINL